MEHVTFYIGLYITLNWLKDKRRHLQSFVLLLSCFKMIKHYLQSVPIWVSRHRSCVSNSRSLPWTWQPHQKFTSWKPSFLKMFETLSTTGPKCEMSFVIQMKCILKSYVKTYEIISSFWRPIVFIWPSTLTLWLVEMFEYLRWWCQGFCMSMMCDFQANQCALPTDPQLPDLLLDFCLMLFYQPLHLLLPDSTF